MKAPKFLSNIKRLIIVKHSNSLIKISKVKVIIMILINSRLQLLIINIIKITPIQITI